MTKNNELKDDIHKLNEIIGRMGFTIDELQHIQDNEEENNSEILDELQATFEELKTFWKKICTSL